MQTVAGVMGNVLEWQVLFSSLLLPLSFLSPPPPPYPTHYIICIIRPSISSHIVRPRLVSHPRYNVPVPRFPRRRRRRRRHAPHPPPPVRYDFALFGFFSDVIATVFFPPPSEGEDDGGGGSTSRLVASFAVYGGAFIMRPVGGLIIGRIGDRHGRKRALVVSLSLMAFPTFLM
jgi:hypothetical protein